MEVRRGNFLKGGRDSSSHFSRKDKCIDLSGIDRFVIGVGRDGFCNNTNTERWV